MHTSTAIVWMVTYFTFIALMTAVPFPALALSRQTVANVILGPAAVASTQLASRCRLAVVAGLAALAAPALCVSSETAEKTSLEISVDHVRPHVAIALLAGDAATGHWIAWAAIACTFCAL